MRLALKFSDQSLAAAAVARRNSLVLRGAHNAAFAVGAGLTTGSVLAPLIWYPIIVAMMVADVAFGRAFLDAPPQRKGMARALFVTSSVAMITAFMGMALSTALFGGEAGRLAAAFMAAGSLVTVMVLMVEAPAFMALSAAPGALLLLALPLMVDAPSAASPAAAMLGLYITLAAFASHVGRTAIQHMALYRRHKDAREDAERRRAEAEAGRAAAEAHRAEAVRANRVKSEFLCTMTHELRTPLNAVINYAEMIGEEAEGQTAEDAGRITRSANHLLGLIDRILDFSTIDSGQLQLSRQAFDVGEAAREAADAHRAAAEANGNEVSVEIDGRYETVADRDRVRQCLDCLLSNAARFTRGGRISVSVTQEAAMLRLAVADTGVGMSAGALESVFEAFVQTDGSKTRAADGLGLGLASARKLARAMGGDITAQSAPGAGSRFELSLPLAASARAAA